MGFSGWVNSFATRWNSWVGDRDMEMAIRKQLDAEGYHGRGAKFHQVKLVAIQRPGWVQLYRFELQVRPKVDSDEEDETKQLVWIFGLAKDDGRRGTKVCCFKNSSQRRARFAEWSEGLITLSGGLG